MSLFAGYKADKFSTELADQIKDGDSSMLAVGHAMSCGLKVLASEISCNGIEACRRVGECTVIVSRMLQR